MTVSRASREVDTPVACYYANDPRRPHCERVAAISYGPIALCESCDRRRSTVGKGQVGRRLVREPSPALVALKVASDRLEDAEAKLACAVGQARRLGHSWGEIGRALGVTRQAAQQRFGSMTVS